MNRFAHSASRFAIAAGALLTASIATADDVPIVKPGAPGQPSTILTADQATKLASTAYAPGDVAFMQGMIVHHDQALEMAKLAKDRTNNPALLKTADRIEKGQADEMKFMRTWLTDRNEEVAMMAMGHAGMDHSHHTMKGMASPEQMAALAAATGTEFDRLFLQLMIRHHLGAVDMVDELHKQPGTAYDPVMFEFTNEVVTDQKAEIDRMNAVLAGLSTDPRAGLAAGFRDAGEAILNLRKVAALPKPAGFFDPANPAQLQPEKPKKDDAKPKKRKAGEEAPKPNFAERGSLLDFAATDMAFKDDLLVAGSYHGFNIYRLGTDGMPGLVSSVVCPGGQGDVSVAGNLLIMSVQDRRARVDCGLEGVADKVSTERFRGIRIFDISDIANPRQVGQVQTCRGSHTHSIVSADDKRLVIYNSGTSYVRDAEELEGCIDTKGDTNTALFSIEVIEVPVAEPAKARIVDRPRIFAADGQINGLWRGGDHGRDEAGEQTQDTSDTNQCHDITVFPAKKIAAGACSGNGIILDVSDPLKPKRIDDVTDKGFAYWHSATFNNDGTKVLFTDEWGGGGRPRCQASDPTNWGADAFYAIENGKLVAKGHYKLPAPQTDKDQLITGGYWSAYWYKGRIYATEISRGLDVFALSPSEFLTAEEIAAAEAAQYPGDVFNPQTQTEVTWPVAVREAAEASRKGG